MHAEAAEVWRRALAGELAWVTGTGQVGALPVVPLELDGLPGVALPYSAADSVASLRRADRAAFIVSDGRARSNVGGVLAGPVTVTDDVDGSRFVADLLPRELVKHPPSRALADSVLLRRENWWWLPRIIVALSVVERTASLPLRTDAAHDGVLVYDGGDGPRVTVVAPAPDSDWATPRVRLVAHGDTPPRGDGGPALIIGHDYTAPDFERWETWTVRGALRGAELLVTDRTGEPGASLEPLGLFQRMRRHRALMRACKEGIAATERSQ